MKLLFIGQVWNFYRAELEALLQPRHEVAVAADLAAPQMARLAQAQVIVTTVLPRAVAERARAVRLVQCTGAGVEQIDRSALPAGVPLCNTLFHGPSMAEYVQMMVLALHFDLLGQDRELRRGYWRNLFFDAAATPRGRLAGKRVLMVGTGEIGRGAAERCAALGLHVTGVNRSGHAAGPAFAAVAGWDQLDALLPEHHYVVLAIPLTASTRGLFDGPRLALMRPDAYLINVARGPVVEEQALYDALVERRLAGAAIDVWYRYPEQADGRGEPASLPFNELDNVIMTPHSSGISEQTFADRMTAIAANIERLVAGEPLQGIVSGDG